MADAFLHLPVEDSREALSVAADRSGRPAHLLERVFGVIDDPFTGVGLDAATNVFMGVTRPRELLGLALRKSEAIKLVGPATHQGWKIVDLVAHTAKPKE